MKTRRRTVIQQFGGKCTARQHSRVWKNTFVASGIHTSKKQKNFKRMKSYIQANMNFSLLAQLFCHSHYTVPPGVTAKLSCSHWGGPSSPSKGINGTTVCLVVLLDPPGPARIHPSPNSAPDGAEDIVYCLHKLEPWAWTALSCESWI